MTARLRESLASLPAYVPGRSVPGAVKLASNESPTGPLPHVVARIAEVAAAANRYPDNNSSELTAALARRHDVDPAQIAVGCGSVSLCQQLVNITAGAGDEVVYAWRSFEAYPIVISVGGATGVPVALTPDHRHDLAAMAAAVTPATRLVFVCNPNNPPGTAVTERERLHDALLAHGYEVPVSQGNFVWLPLAEDAVAFAAELESHKVIVRAFAGSGVRVTVSSPDDDDAFLAAVPDRSDLT